MTYALKFTTKKCFEWMSWYTDRFLLNSRWTKIRLTLPFIILDALELGFSPIFLLLFYSPPSHEPAYLLSFSVFFCFPFHFFFLLNILFFFSFVCISPATSNVYLPISFSLFPFILARSIFVLLFRLFRASYSYFILFFHFPFFFSSFLVFAFFFFLS